MLTLVLDLAYSQYAGLFKNDNLIDQVFVESANNSDRYMQVIDNLLIANNISINQIEAIALNKGPGSFTGLRVAIAIAKGFGFDSSIKFLTFSSFDYILQKKEENILLPGFSSFLYMQNNLKHQDCVDVNLIDKNLDYVVYDNNLYNKLMGLGFSSVRFSEKQTYADILKGIEKNYLNLNQLEPLYLRKSQAELDKIRLANKNKK